jgi:ribosomal protein S18 acetylase RimI-like enzyme
MIKIRKAQLEEYKAVQKLNFEVFEDNYKYDSDLNINWTFSEHGQKYFVNLFQDKDAVCFVAEENNVLIGYVAARMKHATYRNSKYLEISDIGVSPIYRSGGIGRQLLKACEEWGKDHGYQRLFVTSYAKNEKAIKFYKNFGFDEIDISLEKDIK